MKQNRRQKGATVGWHRQPFDCSLQISAQYDDVLAVLFAILLLTVIFLLVPFGMWRIPLCATILLVCCHSQYRWSRLRPLQFFRGQNGVGRCPPVPDLNL